jgi:hypothetical protein
LKFIPFFNDERKTLFVLNSRFSTAKAIKFMADIGFSAEHGARLADPDVVRVGIVITDGTVH